MCAPTRAPLDLVAYAARRFTALPHTTVYIDAGAAWWPLRPAQAADMLIGAGIRHVRGFAMNDTQYDSPGRELEWGANIEGELAARGVHGKHMIVNTAESGRAIPVRRLPRQSRQPSGVSEPLRSDLRGARHPADVAGDRSTLAPFRP